jgi:hypothetical protein
MLFDSDLNGRFRGGATMALTTFSFIMPALSLRREGSLFNNDDGDDRDLFDPGKRVLTPLHGFASRHASNPLQCAGTTIDTTPE